MKHTRLINLVLMSCVLGIFVVLGVSTASAKKYHAKSEPKYQNTCTERQDHISIDWEFKHGSVILTNRDEDTRVEITDEYQLFINDRRIPTNDEQTALLKDYHTTAGEVVTEAKKIGIEGAKIGISGAALGLKAVGCMFKLLSPNYDSDDLERDMDYESGKIELKASELEEKAKVLEKKADRLDELADEMNQEIPELGELGWF